MPSRPRDGYVLWLILGAIACAIAVFLLQNAAHAKPRSQQHWGGSDLPVSCETVRNWRRPASMMSRAKIRQLEREFNVTPKWRRQAYACLRGSKS